MHFKSSTNRAPRQFTPRRAGENRQLHLELKVLADVGLLGMPNAGKSTLIRAVSSARPKVADYPFTTLHPNLGVVRVDMNRSFVIADIPGLIEGAAEGAGLGHQFLRHLPRTRLLLHLVDIAPLDPDADPAKDARAIAAELKKYDPALYRKPRWLVFNKIDLLPEGERAARVGGDRAPAALEGTGVRDLGGRRRRLPGAHLRDHAPPRETRSIARELRKLRASSKRFVVKVGSSLVTNEAPGSTRPRSRAGRAQIAHAARRTGARSSWSRAARSPKACSAWAGRRGRERCTSCRPRPRSARWAWCRATRSCFREHGLHTAQVLLDARRSGRSPALPQRALDAAHAARTRRDPGHQRERHRGHRRDQIRRQRHARRAGHQSGRGRLPGDPHRQAGAVHRRSAPRSRGHAGARGSRAAMPALEAMAGGAGSLDRQGRHADQGARRQARGAQRRAHGDRLRSRSRRAGAARRGRAHRHVARGRCAVARGAQAMARRPPAGRRAPRARRRRGAGAAAPAARACCRSACARSKASSSAARWSPASVRTAARSRAGW